MEDFDYQNYLKNNPLTNEIKINNPSKTFTFTDKFRQDQKDRDTFQELAKKFIPDIDIYEDEGLLLDIINIEMYADEEIVNLESSNNIDEVFSNLVEAGYYEDTEKDKGYYKNLLKSWLEEGWITKISV